MTVTDADAFLHLLRANPSLLPPYVDPIGGDLDAVEQRMAGAIDWRRQHEVHTCLRCGGRARCAFVAHTEDGPRWLDLCAACTDWLRRGAT